MELGGSLLTGKKSTSELFSSIITSDEIDHDYISEFYNHDLSIQYKYGIVKPDQICNLLNEESEDFENIDADEGLWSGQTAVKSSEDVAIISDLKEKDRRILEQYFIEKK